MLLIAENVPIDAKIQWKLTLSRLEEWWEYDVFRFKWWSMLVLFIICVCIWWKLADKSKLNELILYTGLITIIIIVLDELGEELTLWDYTTDLIPLFPPVTAINLSCLPMVYALIYQYFRPWKSFVIATFIMSVIFCFVCEPIFVWAGIYQMISWKSYYGLPIYFFIAIIGKVALGKIYIGSKN